jgi:hypothetical protein
MILIRAIKDTTMRIITSVVFMVVPILNIHVVIIHTLAYIIGYNHAVQENGLYNSPGDCSPGTLGDNATEEYHPGGNGKIVV